MNKGDEADLCFAVYKAEISRLKEELKEVEEEEAYLRDKLNKCVINNRELWKSHSRISELEGRIIRENACINNIVDELRKSETLDGALKRIENIMIDRLNKESLFNWVNKSWLPK